MIVLGVEQTNQRVKAEDGHGQNFDAPQTSATQKTPTRPGTRAGVPGHPLPQ